MRGLFKTVLMLTASVLLLMACEPKPQPIQFGSDQCEYCRMMITEPQFASQVVNKQGRTFPFDSIECMVAHDLTTDNPDNIHSHWVPDFTNSDVWLQAQEAHYLHSETLRSPMGLYLSAYGVYQVAEEYHNEYLGTLLEWNEVRDLVRQEWLSNRDNQPHNHNSH